MYEPSGHVRGTLMVNPATAVPQTYYGRFAQWSAQRGFRVVTFDYRGIGASLHGSTQWQHGFCSGSMSIAMP